MKIASRLLLACLAIALLAACGNKGPLVKPTPGSAGAPTPMDATAAR